MQINCLTVLQPYASLIVAGIKPVENRSWQTNYRGKLYIHAGAKWHSRFDPKAPKAMFTPEQWISIPMWLQRKIIEMELPTKAIIGRVHLQTCAQFTLLESPWSEPNHYHWIMNKATHWAPIPTGGKQRIWAFQLNPQLIKYDVPASIS